jgi:hypothetical protein
VTSRDNAAESQLRATASIDPRVLQPRRAARGIRLVTWALAAAASLTAAAAQQQLSFYTVTPCRVIDTRNPPSSVGGPALAAGKDRAIPIAGRCGVSTGARAVSINLTATDGGADGTLTMAPVGLAFPPTSTLSVRAGVTRAGAAVIKVGDGGAIKLRASMPNGTQTQFIVDVNGYFANPAEEAGTKSPAFDPPPGAYVGTRSVTITSSTPGATIRYTLDGSPPNASSPLYSGPVSIAATAVPVHQPDRHDHFETRPRAGRPDPA